MGMRNPFRLYDIFDKPEFLGAFATFEEVQAACRKRDEETDGEWCPLLRYRGNATGVTITLENWTY